MDDKSSFHEVLSQTSFNMESAISVLYDSLKDRTTGKVELKNLFGIINSCGIELDDPRLAHFMKKINEIARNDDTRQGILVQNLSLDKETFEYVFHENLTMLLKVVSNDFCIPRFSIFADSINEIFEECRGFEGGENAQYIPQLAEVDGSYWGCSVCTVDGQRHSCGDSTKSFTLQSTSKPLTYALAITENGSDYVHNYVGYEPSGHKFNMVILNESNKPHNPLINSGAIVVVSLLEKGLELPKRFVHIHKQISKMAGDAPLSFSNAVYLSERSSADRNFSLAYYMREHNCYPPGSQLNETLDLYFQLCSVEANCNTLSVIAACLANGGVNPITGERVLSGAAVRDTLSVMHSCGMYDYSGQFAFKVGLPAKSGVSGAIMLVVPNLMGIALYSPQLDKNGNSVRGIEFCQRLVERFVFHNYDSQLHSVAKMDPRKINHDDKLICVVRVLFAAHHNDTVELRRCLIHEMDVSMKDYDDRTGLHVAASSGSAEAVDFFVEVAKVDINVRDRWNKTPLDDAIMFGHEKIVNYLKKRNAKRGIELSIGSNDDVDKGLIFDLESHVNLDRSGEDSDTTKA